MTNPNARQELVDKIAELCRVDDHPHLYAVHLRWEIKRLIEEYEVNFGKEG